MPIWTAKMTPDHFRTALHTKQYDVAHQICVHEKNQTTRVLLSNYTAMESILEVAYAQMELLKYNR